MPHVVIFNPKNGTRTLYDLEKRITKIGRLSDNDIILTDDRVSRYHAEIIRQAEDEYVVQDLNSSNGSYVNGRRVIKASIDFGDIIQIGGAQIRYLEKPHVSEVDEDVLADLVSDFFDDGEQKQIKKRFEIDDSGLIDLSNVDYFWTPIPYDLDQNGHVGVEDIMIALEHYGEEFTPGTGFDFDEDGDCDIFDIVIVAKHYCNDVPPELED